MKRLLQRFSIVIITALLLVIAGFSGFKVFDLSRERAAIKRDYSLLNNITYGLLSVNAWRDHMVRVVTHRIDDFEFTPEQEKALKAEVSEVLHAVINKADSMINAKQKTFKGKIRKVAVKALYNEDKLHKRVPQFSETIVKEITNKKNKERLKFLIQSKLEQFGSITYDSINDVNRVQAILAKYEAASLEEFNTRTDLVLNGLQDSAHFFMFVILGVMICFLVLWWLVRDAKVYHTPLFIMSVLLALIVLFAGLTSPMIEIDARIKELTFHLIGEPIEFKDQVIFFQSKSIVDVVHILLETGKYDSILVGILIMAFSILFPVAKILSTKLYLLGKTKWRHNKVIRFFAFKSGKWSMADVYVVAIFMAYIGFRGILDDQISGLTMKTDSLVSISTSETTLQPGFVLFIGFVLFSLILSEVLNRITVREQRKKRKANPVPTPALS
ncbi:MAG TPA: paraquat-inducible protein A [Cyclobacteriaceae bacterium]|nr:paraquat-inducible protein A [Cyclobacteriaceae bacterium]HMV10643.1 paraquat-inducible protein A [Cyclobacteriaceae bacterium]HMV91153.1 paraquat-inducible protein A [Cyclobacteriaceae bacterium]HMX02504.1 paraquat-inducible protein A [Cyclobacteriaceae bacterium]HMX52066.1 paraquat-inducible protein A [Cyclobacteriaceae bacterium]